MLRPVPGVAAASGCSRAIGCAHWRHWDNVYPGHQLENLLGGGTRRRRHRVVDWPHAWIGAAHCDVLTLLSSTQLDGIDPRPLAGRHPLTRDLDDLTVNATLALHAGFLLRVAASAGPSADPDIIAMMTALGNASLKWLRDRL